MRNKKLILTLVLLALSIGLGTQFVLRAQMKPLEGASPSPEAVKEGIEVGQRAPDFTLSDLAGRRVRLSNLRGKPIFLNFFATWCPPCRVEMPHMNELSLRLKGELAVVAVSVDNDPRVVEAFAKDQDLAFTVVLDSKGEVARRYLVRAIPVSFFLDKDGIIVEKHIGMMSNEDMQVAVEKAMN